MSKCIECGEQLSSLKVTVLEDVEYDVKILERKVEWNMRRINDGSEQQITVKCPHCGEDLGVSEFLDEAENIMRGLLIEMSENKWGQCSDCEKGITEEEAISLEQEQVDSYPESYVCPDCAEKRGIKLRSANR